MAMSKKEENTGDCRMRGRRTGSVAGGCLQCGAQFECDLFPVASDGGADDEFHDDGVRGEAESVRKQS